MQDDTKHGAGVAVGVVDANQFEWEKQNLGASPHSWCFSKTGKKGDGSGFQVSYCIRESVSCFIHFMHLM
jgi:hypothetical protein